MFRVMRNRNKPLKFRLFFMGPKQRPKTTCSTTTNHRMARPQGTYVRTHNRMPTHSGSPRNVVGTGLLKIFAATT